MYLNIFLLSIFFQVARIFLHRESIPLKSQKVQGSKIWILKGVILELDMLDLQFRSKSQKAQESDI